VRLQPVTRVRIEAEVPLPTHLDGEGGPPSPLAVSVRPGALRLRV
jgi:diacylglycerol kinase family enzyme